MDSELIGKFISTIFCLSVSIVFNIILLLQIIDIKHNSQEMVQIMKVQCVPR